MRKKLTDPNSRLKEKLELHFPGDGRLFLNFWDWAHGNDVVVEVIDGKLWYTPPSEELPHTIAFIQFLDMVIESINKRTV